MSAKNPMNGAYFGVTLFKSSTTDSNFSSWLVLSMYAKRCPNSLVWISEAHFERHWIKHRVPIICVARQVHTSDFTQFTHILASDNNNLRDLERIKPLNATAEVRLWGSYLDDKPILDPYYGGTVSIVCCVSVQSLMK